MNIQDMLCSSEVTDNTTATGYHTSPGVAGQKGERTNDVPDAQRPVLAASTSSHSDQGTRISPHTQEILAVPNLIAEPSRSTSTRDTSSQLKSQVGTEPQSFQWKVQTPQTFQAFPQTFERPLVPLRPKPPTALSAGGNHPNLSPQYSLASSAWTSGYSHCPSNKTGSHKVHQSKTWSSRRQIARALLQCNECKVVIDLDWLPQFRHYERTWKQLTKVGRTIVLTDTRDADAPLLDTDRAFSYMDWKNCHKKKESIVDPAPGTLGEDWREQYEEKYGLTG